MLSPLLDRVGIHQERASKFYGKAILWPPEQQEQQGGSLGRVGLVINLESDPLGAGRLYA